MNKAITSDVKPRLFALLALGFVLATIIGTLTHEAAHYVAAKHYGFKPVLHYASVSYGNSKPTIIKEFDSVYSANKTKIISQKTSPEKEAFLKYRSTVGKELKRQYFNVRLAGPVQTILTGSLGLVLLWIRQSKIAIRRYLKFWEWLCVLLSLFWSRQLANCFILIFKTITGNTNLRGDEVRISNYLNISYWYLNVAGAALATAAILWIVFKVLPQKQRLTFIVAGLAGSALGWLVWMEAFGPAILP